MLAILRGSFDSCVYGSEKCAVFSRDVMIAACPLLVTVIDIRPGKIISTESGSNLYQQHG